MLSREAVRRRVQDREVIICVFGLGRMGLPLGCAFADVGFRVVGVDVDSEVVKAVNSGRVGFEEPGLDEILARVVESGRLTATLEGSGAVQKSDFILCIVPLGLDREKKPDLSSVVGVAETISRNLRRGQVVSFETTLPLGTTEGVLRPILEESGLQAGRDFGLVYAPERLMAGRVFSRLRELRKIVGGVDEKSSFIAGEIYRTIHPSGISIVEDPGMAEMIKLAAGVWRDVNIAFANEMAKVADEYGIDINRVVEEVNSSPRRMMLRPGCGVGGHCIPVYPYFLISRVRSEIPVIEAARRTNESMPQYTVALAEEELKKRGKSLEDSHVVVLGLAFRSQVKQVANSPTLDIIALLKKEGAQVSVYDPLFEKEEVEKITGVESGDLEELLKEADCVILSTMHGMFEKIGNALDSGCVLIDGRNRLETADKGIGR